MYVSVHQIRKIVSTIAAGEYGLHYIQLSVGVLTFTHTCDTHHISRTEFPKRTDRRPQLH